MAAQNDNTTESAGLEISRANMIFSTIKEIAEDLEFHPDADFEVVKKLLSIIGLSTLGYELTNNALSSIETSEVAHG